jgi:nucleoside-triphosphatase THEP1
MTRILAGPVRSGKTTALLHWSQRRDDCGGVLSPDVDGRRVLQDARTGERIRWQKDTSDSPGDVRIGRFVFDQRAFDVAVGWLDAAVADPAVRYVILDEVGPLELSGGGWGIWLKHRLPLPDGKELIVVVRDNLVNEVVARYLSGSVTVLHTDDFRS